MHNSMPKGSPLDILYVISINQEMKLINISGSAGIKKQLFRQHCIFS